MFEELMPLFTERVLVVTVSRVKVDEIASTSYQDH